VARRTLYIFTANFYVRKLKFRSTDNLKCINREWLSLLLLYCLHIKRYKNQLDDFNIYYLCRWLYSKRIIALAKKDYCRLYILVVNLKTLKLARASSFCISTSTCNSLMSPLKALAIDSQPLLILTQLMTLFKAKSHYC
jgi:hypothetical protein